MLVRHAESDWNASGRWQGQSDAPLSARGREQATALARSLESELKDGAPPPLYSSDLTRAMDTARPLADLIGREPVALQKLRELDVGSWSGLIRTEIEAREPELLARFESDDADVRPGGGETRREIRARAHEAIEEIVHAHPDCPRIIVVTHLGFLRALLPGAEPANASVLRVSAQDALTRRQRQDVEHHSQLTSPL